MSSLPINSPIKGPGLTKPGVVILQFVVIFLFAAVELLFRSSFGFFGGTYLGRTGTAYVTAVAPPVSLLLSYFILLPTIGGSSFAPTKLLIDLVTALAAVSFYLLSGAGITWFIWFKKERNQGNQSLSGSL
ncbi:MAG: hypothetical protein GM47_2695 [actinobacterium acIB-AMD-6]|nr:MAG: hypothetical protein GM47_2695 [actinobacterium acIB-AMD-6]